MFKLYFERIFIKKIVGKDSKRLEQNARQSTLSQAITTFYSVLFDLFAKILYYLVN